MTTLAMYRLLAAVQPALLAWTFDKGRWIFAMRLLKGGDLGHAVHECVACGLWVPLRLHPSSCCPAAAVSSLLHHARCRPPARPITPPRPTTQPRRLLQGRCVLPRPGPPVVPLLSTMLGACRSLAAMHDRGYAHNDVKGGNFGLDQLGEEVSWLDVEGRAPHPNAGAGAGSAAHWARVKALLLPCTHPTTLPPTHALPPAWPLALDPPTLTHPPSPSLSLPPLLQSSVKIMDLAGARKVDESGVFYANLK